jgi:hypothetical protein
MGGKEQKDIDYNDYYRKLLNMVKLEGDDPVWRKYANIADPTFNVMSLDQLKKYADQLWQSKI